MTYRVRFEGHALVQLHGLPGEGFDALLARVVELMDAPWDAVVMPPAMTRPTARPCSAPDEAC